MTSLRQIIEDRGLEENRKVMLGLLRGQHTSFSAVSTYLKCPRQYRYKYVQLETPEFISSDLLFGIAFHKVVAGFYSHFKAEGWVSSATRLVENWETIFGEVIAEAKYPVRFKKPKEELVDLGGKMLTAFVEGVKPRRVVAVEVPFSVPLFDPRTGETLEVDLVGSIDLIEADEAGSLIVSDLKTAGKKWSDLEADQSLQASLYSFVVAEMGWIGGDEVLVRFDVVTKAKKPAFQQIYTTRGKRDHKRILRLMVDVLQAAEARCFHVNPGWMCSGCQYRRRCDVES